MRSNDRKEWNDDILPIRRFTDGRIGANEMARNKGQDSRSVTAYLTMLASGKHLRKQQLGSDGSAAKMRDPLDTPAGSSERSAEGDNLKFSTARNSTSLQLLLLNK